MSVNQDLLNAAIRHAIHSERFGKGLAKRIVVLLDEADADLTDQLERRLNRIIDGRDTGPATTRRLTEILDAIRVLNDEVYRKVAAGLEAELTDLAAFEIENQAQTLSRIIPVNVNAVVPSATLIKTLVTETPIDGYLLGSWVEAMGANRLARIEKALRIGMVEGETVDQLVRRIRGTRARRYKDGILEISRRSATTLALTANSTIANAARGEVYRANATIIRKLKWVATLDTRTSPTCQARDGRIYEIDKPHPTPPAHPRCRSLLIPITVSFRELGIDRDEVSPRARASMDGQVPGSTTFGDWLKGQPRERVEEIMGKERAEMFLSGRIPFSEFFDHDDQYYNLAELKRRAG